MFPIQSRTMRQPRRTHHGGVLLGNREGATELLRCSAHYHGHAFPAPLASTKVHTEQVDHRKAPASQEGRGFSFAVAAGIGSRFRSCRTLTAKCFLPSDPSPLRLLAMGSTLPVGSQIRKALTGCRGRQGTQVFAACRSHQTEVGRRRRGRQLRRPYS